MHSKFIRETYIASMQPTVRQGFMHRKAIDQKKKNSYSTYMEINKGKKQ